MNSTDKHIHTVRYRRKQCELTQADMAKLLDLTRQSYIQIEAGKLTMNRKRAQRFCEALRLNWGDLVAREESIDTVLRAKGLLRKDWNRSAEKYTAYDLLEDCDPLENSKARMERADFHNAIALQGVHHEITCDECALVQANEYMYGDENATRNIPPVVTKWLVIRAFVHYVRSNIGTLPYFDDEYLQILTYLVEVEYARLYNRVLFGIHYKKLPGGGEIEGWDLEVKRHPVKAVTTLHVADLLNVLPASAMPIIDAFIGMARIREKPSILGMLWADHAWYGTTAGWYVPYIEYYAAKRDLPIVEDLQELQLTQRGHNKSSI